MNLGAIGGRIGTYRLFSCLISSRMDFKVTRTSQKKNTTPVIIARMLRTNDALMSGLKKYV